MSDKEFLARAIEISQQSSEPVACGVIIVSNGEIIGEAFNSQRADNIAINHAEMKAVVMANKKMGKRKLSNAAAYCSCEPCAMCLTALSYAKVRRIVYNKTMLDMFPNDPQSKLNSKKFLSGLNFIPEIEQLQL